MLQSTAEYDAAVAEIDALLESGAAPGTDDDDRLQFLSLLVEAYEEEHYPMGESVTPQSIVDFMLDQKGLARTSLYDRLGGSAAAEAFFAGTRELTRDEIKDLRAFLGIPADLLL